MPSQLLVVEDETATRMIIAKFIRKLGYEPLLAENGIEALHLLKEGKHEVAAILVDQFMPLMDGFELIAAIKVNEKLAQIPCILCSSDLLMREKARKGGHFFAWLRKPLDLQSLQAVLTHPALALQAAVLPKTS